MSNYLKAHVCVSTTAREAHQLGYEVVLPEDAIGDRDIPGASGEDVTKVNSYKVLSYGTLLMRHRWCCLN